jgi:hypothetical protein
MMGGLDWQGNLPRSKEKKSAATSEGIRIWSPAATRQRNKGTARRTPTPHQPVQMIQSGQDRIPYRRREETDRCDDSPAVGGASRKQGERRTTNGAGRGRDWGRRRRSRREASRGRRQKKSGDDRTPAQRYATGGAGSGSGPVHLPLRLHEKLSSYCFGGPED